MYTFVAIIAIACLLLYYLVHGRIAKVGKHVIMKSEPLMMEHGEH
jgi:hypothetical protein